MKTLLRISSISLSISSWVFFLFLIVLVFSPGSLIKSIDRYILTTHSIEFSNLKSSGNILNRNLKFINLSIKQNERVLILAEELEIGFSLKPQSPFSLLNINRIHVKDGYFDQLKIDSKNSSSISMVSFSREISLAFKNFKYKKDESIFEINGEIFGNLSKSISGQVSLLHDRKLSTIAVNSVEDSYRFSLNLHPYDWFNLIPALNNSPIQDLIFQINALGELQENQSNVKGSFASSSLSLESLSINQNKGSFHFQSINNIGELALAEFLHPFIDDEYAIQINLKKKSISVPRIFLSPEIFKIEALNLKNLIVENLFISLNTSLPKYSGFIRELDLHDLYFKEINNLSGEFSGNGNNIKLIANSDSSILKNYNQNFIPVSIVGEGNLSGAVFDLKAHIKNKSAGIDLALQLNPKSTNSFFIELKGDDVSKDLITFSLPKSLKGVSSYIDTNIKLGNKNTIYLNYSIPSNGLETDLKAKILSTESILASDQGLKIDFSRPIIEADSKNLYIFTPSGKITNFLYDEAYGLINYKTQKLRFYSLHDMKSIDLKSLLSTGSESFNLPDIKALHKGEIRFKPFKLNNAISAKTKNFFIPTYQSDRIQFDKANIFIVDLDLIHGSLPSIFMKKEMPITLLGTGLTKKYDLTFSTNVNLNLREFNINSSYLKVSGNDYFNIDLNIQKDSLPILKINSDLQNIELNSPLDSLSKNKLISLPTEILITNFSNPSIKVRNEKIDIHIRDLGKYNGYISIGSKLPDQYKNFNYDSGLNIYINSQFIDENLLISMLPGEKETTSTKFNKLAFDIKNFKFFNNNFSNLSGLFDLNSSGIRGNFIADKLNLNLRMDQTGFLRIEIKDSAIPDTEFFDSSQSSFDRPINSRLIVKNSSFGKVKIKELDVYLVNNRNNFSANNIKLKSNLISISQLNESSKAYFSVDKEKPLYKIRGDFLFKDSKKIPYLRDVVDFSYFDGSINLQWKELSSLSHIEGVSSFILKDLAIKDSIADSLAFNLLGVLNLKNILGKLANFDLSIDEFTSTQLSRVEGDLLFNKSKLRLVSPLFVETNTAKMRWVGQINKNYRNKLDALDLNLDLRVRVGENLPWYAAILGGLPAVAGSAVINEIFEEDINNLTNYQYEVSGTISEPKLERVKQEIK
ncbi:AsmA-like C-terminal region-containing protein [Gammaproteobacteria bacterium]|nr:AsmA-like C-terminal region-containing protein [Gammaproteobacteria bacterium]